MVRRPPRSTRTYTLFPYTPLFRSQAAAISRAVPACSRTGTEDFHGRKDTRPVGCHRLRRRCAHRDGDRDDPRRGRAGGGALGDPCRSEEHTSELQSLMRISYAVFCLKKKKKNNTLDNKIETI